MSKPTSQLTWIKCSDALPPMNTFVLVYRLGGQNNHNDIGIGFRRHKWGTRDEWVWVDTGMNQDYWGVSCDGSDIVCWAEKPHPPARMVQP